MSNAISVVEKNPFDVLDYDVDFTRWMSVDDVIIGADAMVDDPIATFSVGIVEFSDMIVKVWVKNGIHGEEAEVRVDATTLFGRIKRVFFKMRIRDVT